MVDNTTVAVDTDNLNDFELLFNGKAEAAPEEKEPVAPVEPEDVPENDDTPEDDSLAPSDSEDAVDIPDDDQEESKTLKLKPKKKSAQERIDEVVANWRQTERELEKALAKLEEKERPKEVGKPVETTADIVKGEPTPDDLDENGDVKYPLGDFDPKYIKDLMKFTFEKEANEAKAKQEAEQRRALEEQAKAELRNEWQEKLTEAEKVYPDLQQKGMRLDSVVANLDPSYGEYLAETIMSLDNGPEVLYYLSDNLEEAKRLVASGPLKATVGLGELNAMFKKKAESPVKVTKAPEPPADRARGTNGRFEIPDDTDDLEAFAKKFYNK